MFCLCIAIWRGEIKEKHTIGFELLLGVGELRRPIDDPLVQEAAFGDRFLQIDFLASITDAIIVELHVFEQTVGVYNESKITQAFQKSQAAQKKVLFFSFINNIYQQLLETEMGALKVRKQQNSLKNWNG